MNTIIKYTLIIASLIVIQLIAWRKIKQHNFWFTKYLPNTKTLVLLTVLKLAIKISIVTYAINSFE